MNILPMHRAAEDESSGFENINITNGVQDVGHYELKSGRNGKKRTSTIIRGGIL